MPRFARVVVAGYPYHLTHRGNRREDVFFAPEDRLAYCKWLKKYAAEHGLQVWAYCLMTNHVHLVVVPERADSLAKVIGRAHMRYARWVNYRQGWSGHLWANRFYSTLLDEEHLWAAAKYVECNPVRVGIVERAEDYRWSSARAHARAVPDGLLFPGRPFPDASRVGGWSAWLADGLNDEMINAIRRNTATGWPTGSPSFLSRLESALGRSLSRRKPGRKPKEKGNT